MHIPLLTAPLVAALLGGLATPPASSPAPARAPSAAQTCYYDYPEYVFIQVGEVMPFFGDNCAGMNISISPADGTAGFSSGTACTKTDVTTVYGVFKVRGCQAGSVTVSISDGGIQLQTIQIIVGNPY